jgi:hypothetical protein
MKAKRKAEFDREDFESNVSGLWYGAQCVLEALRCHLDQVTDRDLEALGQIEVWCGELVEEIRRARLRQ